MDYVNPTIFKNNFAKKVYFAFYVLDSVLKNVKITYHESTLMFPFALNTNQFRGISCD